VAAQQYSLLFQTHDTLRLPQAALYPPDLLMSYIKQCPSLGPPEILLVGDFKECMDHNPDGMRKVMGEECHLVNEMKHCHPGKQLPNMYVQGHQQSFDYALATEPVTMAVQHTGYEPVNSHFPTDHRPYYIDLSAPISFGLHLQLWAKYEPSFWWQQIFT
jgi:hypothetical protein